MDYRAGDAHQLEFADQTFDGCRADRVFMYLEDPRLALAEMIRVARSGALIVVFDVDGNGVMVHHPDRGLTRKMLQLGCERARQGWMGRQLPALFQERGLEEVTITAHAVLPDYAFFTQIYRGLLNEAQEAGILSSSGLIRWWNFYSKRTYKAFFSGSSRLYREWAKALNASDDNFTARSARLPPWGQRCDRVEVLQARDGVALDALLIQLVEVNKLKHE